LVTGLPRRESGDEGHGEKERVPRGGAGVSIRPKKEASSLPKKKRERSFREKKKEQVKPEVRQSRSLGKKSLQEKKGVSLLEALNTRWGGHGVNRKKGEFVRGAFHEGKGTTTFPPPRKACGKGERSEPRNPPTKERTSRGRRFWGGTRHDKENKGKGEKKG